MKKIILVSLFLIVNSSAQKRYLVSPNDEVIPLKKGSNPSGIIAQRTGHSPLRTTTCSIDNRFTFGYPPSPGYPPIDALHMHHKDVIGEWFVSKVAGTIDTLY